MIPLTTKHEAKQKEVANEMDGRRDRTDTRGKDGLTLNNKSRWTVGLTIPRARRSPERFQGNREKNNTEQMSAK